MKLELGRLTTGLSTSVPSAVLVAAIAIGCSSESGKDVRGVGGTAPSGSTLNGFVDVDGRSDRGFDHSGSTLSSGDASSSADGDGEPVEGMATGTPSRTANGVQFDAGGNTGGDASGGVGETGSSERLGMSLYYVRHAETLANVSADFTQLSYEEMDRFTELGERQIRDLTEFLLSSNIEPDAVIVSPSTRTQRTIEPYLSAAGLTGEIWMELTECCDQEPTGAPPTEATLHGFFKATLEGENLSFRDDESTSYWNNQSYEEGLFMVMSARDALLSEFSNTGNTVLVSGHAVAGSILIGLLLGQDMSQGPSTFQFEHRLFMMNTGIQHLAQDPETGGFHLVETNINSPEQQ